MSNACIQTDQFQCAHGKKCLPKDQMCDGVTQCQDRSDEMHCTVQTDDCVHHCDSKSRCLPANLICDGERDCLDGTDEANCGRLKWYWESRVHILHSMQSCIIDFYLAPASEDQEEDRYEKEEGASTTSVPTSSVGSPTPIKCPLGSKPCKDNTECVLYNHVCDGEADCRDGSDEKECLSACETGNLVVLCVCDILLLG